MQPADTLRRGLRPLGPLLPDRYRSRFAALAVLGLAIGMLEASVVAAIGELTAHLESGGSTGSPSMPIVGDISVRSLVIAGLVASAIAIVFRVAEARWISQLGVEPMTRIRDRLLRRYLETSTTRQRTERLGELQDLLMTHAPRVGMLGLHTATAVSSSAMLLVLMLVAAIVDVVAFVTLTVVFLALLALMVPVQRLVQRLASRQGSQGIEYAAAASETIGAATELRLFDTASVAADRVGADSDLVSQLTYRTKLLARVAPIVYRSAVFALLLVGLGLVSSSGIDDVGAASTVALLMLRVLIESRTLHAATLGIAEGVPFLTEVNDRLESYGADEVRDGSLELGPVTEVEFQAVDFAFDQDAMILNGLDLTLAHGEKVGVVGPSGAGKSTILALLLGLSQPRAGQVLINGHPPNDYTFASQSRQIAYVPQFPVILTASVRENIRFFRPWVTDQQIVDAAKRAGILDEVTDLVDGLDTVIGDRGARALSGGQRQRVCIARALAGAPTLLVLDEPTSALDSASEEVVRQTLGSLGAECGVIVVSHRPSALAACDRVVQLEDGVISESTRPPH